MTLDPLLATPEAPEDDAASAPLVRRLASLPGAGWVDLASLDDFAQRPGDRVLFFHGDPVRFPEAVDVAVVLPELQRAFPSRFTIGVTVRRDEDAIAARYGVQRWPSLVFLRDGRYVSTLAGMHDWSEFVAAVGQALETPVSRAPSIGIRVVAEGAFAPACR